MTDTNQHKVTPKDDLTSPKLIAIRERIAGASYYEISCQIDVPVDTVKNWFRKGTIVRGVYEQYLLEITRETKEQALNQLKMAYGTAIENVTNAVYDPETPQPVKLRASIYLIDKLEQIMEREQTEREAAIRKIIEIENLYFKSEDWMIEGKMTPEKLDLYRKAYEKHQHLL